MKFVNLINHVAIIMDGNARWAKKKKIKLKEGYKRGLDKIEEIVEICLENKIKYLTLFALSSENFYRPNVNIIFELISNNVDVFLEEITKNNNVKLKVFGNTNDLPKNTKNIIEKIELATQENNKLYLNVALNYGSKNELVYCFNKLLNKKKSEDIVINEKIIRDNLYLSNVPDPDLLIRTGGFQRLSNFLLFQLSYTDLYFTKTLWPDISKREITKIFDKYRIIDKKHGL